jgi:hypothetical protein
MKRFGFIQIKLPHSIPVLWGFFYYAKRINIRVPTINQNNPPQPARQRKVQTFATKQGMAPAAIT